MPSINTYLPSTSGSALRYRVNVCEGSVHITQEGSVGRGGKWAAVGNSGTLGSMSREDAKALAELILKSLDDNF